MTIIDSLFVYIYSFSGIYYKCYHNLKYILCVLESMTNKTVSLNKLHIKRYFEDYFVNLKPSTSYMLQY